MNKAAEIAHLAAFIATLPADSYLANWLTYAAPHIAADIQNNIFPTATPAQARQESAEIIKSAEDHAKKVRTHADQDAQAIYKAARDKSAAEENRMERIAAGIRSACYAAERALNN